MSSALAYVERQELNGRASARNILQEIAECWEDVWLIRNKLRPVIQRGDTPDLETVDALLKTIAQARGNCQTAINVMGLAMEWERHQAEQAQASDTSAELRDLIAETLPEETLRQGIEQALAGPLGAGVAGQVAELLAPVLGPWIADQFEAEGEG